MYTIKALNKARETYLETKKNIYWWQMGYQWAVLLPLIALPLAIVVTKNVFKTEPSPIYNKFLGQSAGLHLVFGLLLALGLSLA